MDARVLIEQEEEQEQEQEEEQTQSQDWEDRVYVRSMLCIYVCT